MLFFDKNDGIFTNLEYKKPFFANMQWPRTGD
jgi:hypothetical protein